MTVKSDLSSFFNGLQGEWTFERRIDNPPSSARGRAVFLSAAENAFAYREEGSLRQEDTGRENAFFRSYLYRLEGADIGIYFADGPNVGGLFQKLRSPETGIVCEAVHHCTPDIYQSTYAFESEAFTITHKVSGPRKAYTSVTKFRKA